MTNLSSPLLFFSNKFKASAVIQNNKTRTKYEEHSRSYRHRRKDQQLPLIHNPTRHFYPKPTPTPLRTRRPPSILTREEITNAVMLDLESAVESGVHVDSLIFSSLLETCFITKNFSQCFRIHRLIPPDLLRNSIHLSSKLLRLYAECGLIEDAQKLFDEMPIRNRCQAFSRNTLIKGYVELDMFEDAMATYYQMEEDNVGPDRYTFPRVLKACAGIGSISIAEGVHRHAIRTGFGNDPFVLNALVDVYSKCGDIGKARSIFDVIQQHDVVSWNSIISGYARHGLRREALISFKEMIFLGFQPDSIAISTILSGISNDSARIGFQIHGWAIRQGLDQNLSVANTLIGMYSIYHRLNQARWIFNSILIKDVVSWNTMIYAHRNDRRVIQIFAEMEGSGEQPDYITFVSLLSACANLGFVDIGREMYALMEAKYKIKPGMEHYSCMVNLFGRAGMVEEAYDFIKKNIVDGGATVWGALLYSCSIHGNVKLAEIAAERLFDLEPDNKHNFELLMKIYGREEMFEDVEYIQKIIESRGLR